MNRRLFAAAAVVTVLLSACSRDGEGAARPDDAAQASAWVRPPHIDGAVREGATLVVRGAAGPDARVVLRGTDGSAVAVSADHAGRFELRLPMPAGELRLTPEVQVGEDAAASPETLVVIAGGAGPIVLIAAGEPTVRLDGRGALDAVDSDGEASLVSGRATGGEGPTVSIDGRRTRVATQPGGDWRLTRPGAGPAVILVDDQSFDYPGVGGGADFTAVRAGAGWRLTWPTGPSGRQTTWLPDRGR